MTEIEKDTKADRRNVRQAEAKQERRRRVSDDPLDAVQLHLSVPSEQDDPEMWSYYWANDDKGRIQFLTERDDWEFCESRDADKDSRNKGGGTHIRRAVGKARDGSTLYAVRLRKRKDWHDADMAEHHRRLDERTNLLRRTQDDQSGRGILSGDPRHGYVPAEIDTSMPRIRRSR
jgi:hypothetical protein